MTDEGHGDVEVISPSTEVVPAGESAMEPAGAVAYPTGLLPAKVLGGLPYAQDYFRLAQRISGTEMVPTAFRGKPDSTFAAIMRGVELGFAPFQALNSFNVIQGSVGLKPEAMRALIVEAGHDFDVDEELDGNGNVIAVVAEAHRSNWPVGKSRTYRYSLADAERNGLLAKDNWKKTPRDMLLARATSGAGRRWFADVLAGMSYTPEELLDFEDDMGDGARSSRSGRGRTATSAGAPDSGDGGAGTPAEGSHPTDSDVDAAVGRAKERTRRAQKATKKPADAAKDAPARQPMQRPAELGEYLDNGELRVTPELVQQIQILFNRVDIDYTREQRLIYVRNVLRDQSITTTWDLSVRQANELIEHLRQVVGDEPPPREGEDAA